MPNFSAYQAAGPYRYYAFWFDKRPAHFWPEVALRLLACEHAEDYVAGLGTPREITRAEYYELPSGARNTRQPRLTPRRATELQ